MSTNCRVYGILYDIIIRAAFKANYGPAIYSNGIIVGSIMEIIDKNIRSRHYSPCVSTNGTYSSNCVTIHEVDVQKSVTTLMQTYVNWRTKFGRVAFAFGCANRQ